MSTLLRCDTCGTVVPQPGRLPSGWRARAVYRGQGRQKQFGGMRHACPACPFDVPRPGEDGLPVLTAQQALLEVEEAARYAALDEDQVRGSSRRLLHRALAILDAARERLGPHEIEPPPGDEE